MPVYCPKCEEKVPAEAVDIVADRATCPHCQRSFDVSSVLPSVTGHHFNPNQPPSGAWFEIRGDEVRMGASTRSIMALMAVPFALIYTGGSLGTIYLPQLLAWEFEPLRSILGLPFLFSGFFFTSYALMTVVGRVEITIRQGRGRIFIGIGRYGWTRRFDWGDVNTIREDKPEPRFYPHNICADSIIIDAKRKLSFGGLLEKARLHYLLNTLIYLRAIS